MNFKKITLLDYIKSPDFDYIQKNISLTEQFKDFWDYRDMDLIDDVFEFKEIFLFQKLIYEELGVYLLFPIVAKFVYEEASSMDCQWCWNSKSISEYEIKLFEEYLLDLITTYELNLKEGENEL